MLEVKHLFLSYRSPAAGTVQAVKDVSFKLGQGEFYTLLGPSGCGKTSTLRSVAGLEAPDSGEIRVGDDVVYSGDEHISISAHKRNTGMVFQSYAIWPHMTVIQNVMLPLTRGRTNLSQREAQERANEALRLVQLETLADRPAPYLSGGQQQRVALARALALEPAVLLLDEPLSNLDAKLREEMRRELKQLVRRINITSLYVTHDQIEALAMSDRVAIMRDGQIVQEGTPLQVYSRPRDTYVAQFLGKANLVQGTISETSQEGVVVETARTKIRCLSVSDAFDFKIGDPVFVACRPESIRVFPTERTGENVMKATLSDIIYMGDSTEYIIALDEQVLTAKTAVPFSFETGGSVYVELPAEACQVLPIMPVGELGQAGSGYQDGASVAPDAVSGSVTH
ncbi:MAG: ABC transporter ATP-binding protein [Nitrospirales bacterium]